MKKIFSLILLASTLTSNAQNHKLEKIWETPTIVADPESVLPDLKQGILYVSLVNGGGWDADGKGGVAKLNADGSQYDSTWVTGLNAPKGLGIIGNKLYAADISEVVVIDITNGNIIKKIAVEGATGLNDITVDKKGIVYVSDTKTAKVWRIENDAPTLYLENMNGANGLKAIGDDLYILSGKSFMKADKNKQLTKVADLPQDGDGIEPVGNGDFIVTSWIGYIYYVTSNGRVDTMLDTHADKKNTADIGYNAANKIVYVPTFYGKQVVAYKLK